jgi:hypothetical protein
MKTSKQETAYKFVEAYKSGKTIEILGAKFVVKKIQLSWPQLGFEADIELEEVIEL